MYLRPLLSLLCLFMFAACGLFSDSKTPEAVLFDCRAAALESLIGDREAAVNAAREIYAGRKSLSHIVEGLAPTQARAEQFIRDLDACKSPAPAPEADGADAGVKLEAS